MSDLEFKGFVVENKNNVTVEIKNDSPFSVEITPLLIEEEKHCQLCKIAKQDNFKDLYQKKYGTSKTIKPQCLGCGAITELGEFCKKEKCLTAKEHRHIEVDI